MNGNFFDRLETELTDIARRGSHLDGAARGRRHAVAAVRHTVLMGVLALALAATLVSGFPASANGRAQVARASVSVVHDV
jgi:hypothetical protein